MRRCASCDNEIPEARDRCDLCGHAVAGTDLEPRRDLPVSAHGRTEYDPGPRVRMPERPHEADAFGGALPPRPGFDLKDPFAASTSAAPLPGLMMRPSEEAAPARSGAGTIIEKPLSRIIRGVLVEYRAPADEGRLHALREGRNKIGRDPDADVVLEEARASGDHAFLFIRGEKVTFQDCSRNGSKVGDRLVWGDQCELGSGSALMIGDTRLVFLLVPEGGAGTP